MYSLRSSISGFLMVGLLATCGTGLAQQKPAVVPDAQVEANVLKALAGSPQLADQAISTTTVYGQVTLSGTVRDEASRDMAEKLASDAPGVQKVVDQLAIGTPTAPSAQAATPDDSQQGQDAAGQGPNPPPQYDGAYGPPPGQQGQNDSAPDQAENDNAPMGPQDGGPPPPPQAGPNAPPYRGPYNRPPYPYGPPPSQGYRQPYTGQQGGESVVVPSGSMIRVRINQGMDSKHTAPGTTFDGIVLNDVVAGNAVAIPRGTAVQGRVVDVHNGGAFKGKGALALQLTQITLGGQTYPIVSDEWTHEGADKTSQTVGNTVGLGAMGALIGAVAGGGPGALVGAGVGSAAGLGASAASGRGEAMVPSEAILTFHLAQQTPLTTVSQAEMNRMAYGIQPGPQQMRRRYPPPPPYYGGPGYNPYYR
jgi:hypothetical protein